MIIGAPRQVIGDVRDAAGNLREVQGTGPDQDDFHAQVFLDVMIRPARLTT